MKLYLSSFHLGTAPERLRELVGNNRKAAVILNAADWLGTAERAKYRDAEMHDLGSLGLEAEELDLRGYFRKQSDLAEALRPFGLVWISGGNTFILRRAMKQSGFDTIIEPLVLNEHIVYAGYSAGSVVATPSLHGIELVDDPQQIPAGYDETVIWRGLNLFGEAIAPHYHSNHPESPAIEHVLQYFDANGIRSRALHDGEALLVRGNTVEIVGSPENVPTPPRA